MTDTSTETPPRRSGAFRPGGLGQRLLLWFLLLALIPLFGSNTIGYLRSQEIIEGLVERFLEGVAEVQGRRVQDRVERHLLALEAIAAGLPPIDDPGPAGSDGSDPASELGAYLEAHLAGARDFHGMRIQVDTLVLGAAGTPYGDSPEQAGLPGEPVRVVRSAGAGPPVLELAVPAWPGRPGPPALLVGTVEIGASQRFLELPEHVAGTIESFVVDEGGRLVWVSHPHGHVDYDHPFWSPLLRLPPGSTWRYDNGEGIRVLGASVDIGDPPWRFITEVPLDEAQADLRSLQRLSLFLEISFGILVVAAAWFIAGGILAPIQRLVTATGSIGSGDLGIRVEAGGGDEIGELGRRFNEMADALEAHERRIEELHQREIERAEQLASVGELAAGIAHEIKNPVVGISNGLDLVARRVGADEQLSPITAEMQRQLARIESAIRDLLAFARPASPTLGPADVDRIVDRALLLVQPAAERGGVELRRGPVGEPVALEADEELVRQALVNLLMNAVQATSPGGTVEVGTTALDGYVQIEVADTGKGIAPEEIEQIFKPFFTTRHSGTGLGLPITRGIVERHGGALEVESRPGEGTVFRIRLPRRAPSGPDTDGGRA